MTAKNVMEPARYDEMLGEWVGEGVMTVGPLEGKITEYLRLEATDVPRGFSYVRKSRIVFPGRTVLHNEIGYVWPDKTALMLSRGSFIILEWDTVAGLYRQVTGSPDSRNMTRKVIISPDSMTWDNFMEVKDTRHGGVWAAHTARTEFTSVTTVSPNP